MTLSKTQKEALKIIRAQRKDWAWVIKQRPGKNNDYEESQVNHLTEMIEKVKRNDDTFALNIIERYS